MYKPVCDTVVVKKFWIHMEWKFALYAYIGRVM